MLTPADAGLAERDPRLPGLAVVLDHEAVLERLAQVASGPPVVAAVATYVRYKPGTSCVVGYRLRTEVGEVLAYAKAFRPGDRAKLEKAAEKERPDTGFGWGVVTDPDGTVVVATASSDRDLPALAALADERRRRELLRALLPCRPDLWDTAPVPLRHKPERRWLGTVGGGGVPAALLKAYRSGDAAAARAGQLLLATPAVPPLGWSRRHAVLASTWVPGQDLSAALAGGAPADVAAVGAALARIHRLPPAPLPAGNSRPQALEVAGQAVAALVPDLGDRARRLAAVVGASLASLPPACTTVHGDFSADQVILAAGGPEVVDFDRAGAGDPAADVGSFAADLDRAEAEGRLRPGRAASAVAELLDGHRRAGGPALGGRVAAHRAAALLRLAVAPFRERHPDWPAATGAVLDRGEHVAAGLR